MHYSKSILSFCSIFGMLFFIFSCQQNESAERAFNYSEKSSAPASEAEFAEDAAAAQKPNAFQTSAAQLNQWDTLKRLIRRAELSFHTPDVLKATLAIEDIVRQHGGFVLENKFNQTEIQRYATRVSEDSILETTVFKVQNKLLVRVPVARLDTAIRAMGQWAKTLHTRHITAQDIELQWLEQELAQLRNRDFQTEIQEDIATSPENLRDVNKARSQKLASRTAADMAKLEQLRLEDEVRLSTVTIDLAQDPVTVRELRARTEPVAAWTPGLGTRLQEAFLSGWSGLENLVIFIIGLWPAILVGACIWWLLRKRRFKLALQKQTSV